MPASITEPAVITSASLGVTNDQNTAFCDSALTISRCIGSLSGTSGNNKQGVLLCETWPSWSFAFRALKIFCKFVFMSLTSSTEFITLQQLIPGVCEYTANTQCA
jgi:hypothetical protein